MRTAVELGVATTGRAVIITAISLMIATLGWTFTSTRFDAEMGLLLFLWMGISFLTSVSLLPAILVVMRPKFLYGEQLIGKKPVAPAVEKTARREARA
jgi:predicted RND superfamily exporter protein